MSSRRLALLSVVLAVLSALSIAFLDVTVARAVAEMPESLHAFFRTGTHWIDVLSTKKLLNSALGLALLTLAAGLWRQPERRALAARLAVVGLGNMLAHLVVGLLKPQFGRLRPYQIESDYIDRFFAGGRSLPSGHTAYYWGFALPCALLFPRARFAVLAPATFIALARVLVNDHFVGDVLASLAITAAVTAGLLALLERRGFVLGRAGVGPRPCG